MKQKIAKVLLNIKDKINKIYQQIRNTFGKFFYNTSSSLKKPSKTQQNSPFLRTVPSKRAKSKTAARRINYKKFIPFTAGIAAVIVLAIIIFSSPPKSKTTQTASMVAGVAQTTQISKDAQEINTEEPENAEKTDANPSPKTSAKKVKAETKEEEALKPNTHSKKVIKIQERLMDLDYMDPDEPTDFYGPQTQYSLQLFQRKHNLQVDGIAGKTTLDLLFDKKARAYTVSLGEQGTDVKELQKRLKELGYLKTGVTGYFGTDTVTAVKEFQKQNGLSIDGNVGSNTREVIYSDDAREYKASRPVTPGKKPTPPKKQKSTKKIPNDKSVKSLIAFAKQHLGAPYVRGGKGPDCFDCSGFVYYCLKSIGFKMQYITSAGWRNSSYPVVYKMSELKAGDILCFRGHVGIYLGGGRMIDASSGQGKVRITGDISKSSYWKRYFVCARRVL